MIQSFIYNLKVKIKIFYVNKIFMFLFQNKKKLQSYKFLNLKSYTLNMWTSFIPLLYQNPIEWTSISKINKRLINLNIIYKVLSFSYHKKINKKKI